MSDDLFSSELIDAGAMLTMTVVAGIYVLPTMFGMQPGLSFEVTVVLLLLNIGTLVME